MLISLLGYALLKPYKILNLCLDFEKDFNQCVSPHTFCYFLPSLIEIIIINPTLLVKQRSLIGQFKCQYHCKSIDNLLMINKNTFYYSKVHLK